MKDKSLILRIFLIALITATLAFTFIQSSLPPEESANESDKVGEIVGEIIPPDTKPGAFIQVNLREIAHFVEFFMLGTEITVYLLIFHRDKRTVLTSVLFAPILALTDESIQHFSNRTPELSDVWLDVCGYVSAAFITALVFFTVRLALAKRMARLSK